MQDLVFRIELVKKMAIEAGLQGVLNWCNEALYMIETYGKTSHAQEVRANVERVLSTLN